MLYYMFINNMYTYIFVYLCYILFFYLYKILYIVNRIYSYIFIKKIFLVNYL